MQVYSCAFPNALFSAQSSVALGGLLEPLYICPRELAQAVELKPPPFVAVGRCLHPVPRVKRQATQRERCVDANVVPSSTPSAFLFPAWLLAKRLCKHGVTVNSNRLSTPEC